MHDSAAELVVKPGPGAEPAAGEPRVPIGWRATYRLQFHAGFNLNDGAAIADYLGALGISHLYASPLLQAAPGSTHGYDVVDPHHVNADLGGETAHARLSAALRAQGLGHLLDIVPNHMAIGTRENAWWWDVLENGASSRFAVYFDVDWDPPEAKLRHRILLPILGERYGRVLQQGDISLHREGGSFTVTYFDHTLPLAPRSLDGLLALAADRLGSDELGFLADASLRLPPATATDASSVARRHRDKEVLRALLGDLFARQPQTAAAVDAVLRETAAAPEALDRLLERQSYRLSYWRAAERELDYRRFFDVNTLIGLRIEDERVFGDTHALILRWLEQGVLDGLRLDHIDGLRDPDQYLLRLRQQAPGAKIWVEKILERGESLPDRWPVAGTTGYDFINLAGGLFVDPAAEASLTDLYAEITANDGSGPAVPYAELARQNKLRVLRESLSSDVNRLTALLLDMCQEYWPARDLTRHELQEALREVVASFPVYRTYIRPEQGVVRDEDRRLIAQAVAEAKERRSDVDAATFDFLAEVLALEVGGRLAAEFVARFQQLTGPAMAKGVEDTALYRYNRFVALNEVGGDPAVFGRSVAEFHAYCAFIQKHWPETLLATSTHDTKRGEDVRARLMVLSEVPRQWAEAVRRWVAHNARYKDQGRPSRDTEYLLYQTLVGAWPIDRERAGAYMLKAAREAKAETSWTEPNKAYEEALAHFVDGVLGDEEFARDLTHFVDSLRDAGWVKSLGQTLLKLTAPGVPDIYQGTELWDFSLVDPDNRRPVDYAKRRRLLAELSHVAPASVWERRSEGLPKLWVIRQALDLRRKDPEAFGPEVSYIPMQAEGSQADAVVAFARAARAVTVVPRYGLRSQGEWGNTRLRLPQGLWRNVLTGNLIPGGDVMVADLLSGFPVALLASEEASS